MTALSDSRRILNDEQREFCYNETQEVKKMEEMRAKLCRMFSASLFQGVREVFSQDGELDPDQLCEVLRIYFGLFLNMFSPAAKGDQR